jgi:agmatine deiminase
MKFLLTALFAVTCATAFCQSLPHVMAPGENAAMPAYLQSRSSVSPAITTPPSSPVRTIGEWEELQGLTITWTSYQSILKEIVRAAKEETRVYIVCSNPATVISYLASYNIDTVNVTCLQMPYNSVWSRDYGLWSAYTNDVDTLLTIDWIYNRPRPLDDVLPGLIAAEINTPFYATTNAPWDLVHTGGNFMTDGFGTGFSSKLTLDENPNHTEPEIDSIMQRFMGIDRYIKMDKLPYDVIHHIDMHMKLLDEETILFGEYPVGIADGPQIEANMLYVLNNYNSVFGTPYKIVRIPMPADNGQYPNTNGDYFTYTNSSFINKTIIVPTYNIPSDTTALRIYRETLPGYTVVGINSTASITALGALHCITKEIGTADPMLISHQPLHDTYDDVNPYTVIARIQHRSGIANAIMYYRTDTLQPYNSVAMSVTGNPLFWEADIPAQSVGSIVYYYIEGNSVSGKHQVRPMPAPAAYWKFKVLGPTSITNNEAELMMLPAFPNPSKGITCIPINSSGDYALTISLRDVLGQEIQQIYKGQSHAGQNRYFFDSSKLTSGIYFIEIAINSYYRRQKLVVR